MDTGAGQRDTRFERRLIIVQDVPHVPVLPASAGPPQRLLLSRPSTPPGSFSIHLKCHLSYQTQGTLRDIEAQFVLVDGLNATTDWKIVMRQRDTKSRFLTLCNDAARHSASHNELIYNVFSTQTGKRKTACPLRIITGR
jgi:hypothetical protein